VLTNNDKMATNNNVASKKQVGKIFGVLRSTFLDL
jgi:hypothetical protein